jgi:2-phospho-L-lactate guanylyltransferase
VTTPFAPLWAVLPVKAFARGKSRLGGVLSDPVREVFARGLFEHVLSTFMQSSEVRGVVVITEDAGVRAFAERHGALVEADPAVRGLAAVVDAGLARAFAEGARAAMVTMADLPCLAGEDVSAVATALRECDLVITPDLVRAGTNMLAMRSTHRFATRFGREDSFAQHLAVANEHGFRAHILERRGLCFDVDGPDDLEQIAPA